MQIVGIEEMQDSTSDRISNLPDNVTEKILTCLPIQDAVRTSILSSKWRYAWVTLPQLVFDELFYRRLRRPPTYKLMMIVFQVLLLHRGPIPKLKLSLRTLESCPGIDRVLLFVSKNGIQELALTISGYQLYKLPSSVFGCPQLKHLELDCCLFNPPPAFKGFSRLISLELLDVDITFQVLSSFISSCPVLEKLKLVGCTGLNDVEISAPRLTCFVLEGELDSVCLNDTPNLARLSVYLHDSITVETPKLVLRFADLPAVEFLELGCQCLQWIFADGIPKRLPTDLSHLKTLKLHLEMDDVSSMICLLQSSPNLEKLAIWLPYHGVEEEDYLLDILDVGGWWDIHLNQLQEVEVLDAIGTRFDKAVVKLLLAKTPILKKMLVALDVMIEELGSEFLTEVKQLIPLSPLVKVSYKIEELDN